MTLKAVILNYQFPVHSLTLFKFNIQNLSLTQVSHLIKNRLILSHVSPGVINYYTV